MAVVTCLMQLSGVGHGAKTDGRLTEERVTITQFLKIHQDGCRASCMCEGRRHEVRSADV